MALGDLLEGGGGWGLGVGLAAGAAIVLARSGRPLLKGALVGYFTLTDRVKTLAAETSEQMQDLYEEARSEYRDALTAEDEVEIVDVEDEPPPPPPKRPRAGRGRARPATGV
jgi:hypothetical protein